MPPDTLAVALPLHAPLQVALFLVAFKAIPCGAVMVTVVVAIHPLASVTDRSNTLAHKLVACPLVCPLLQRLE